MELNLKSLTERHLESLQIFGINKTFLNNPCVKEIKRKSKDILSWIKIKHQKFGDVAKVLCSGKFLALSACIKKVENLK